MVRKVGVEEPRVFHYRRSVFVRRPFFGLLRLVAISALFSYAAWRVLSEPSSMGPIIAIAVVGAMLFLLFYTLLRELLVSYFERLELVDGQLRWIDFRGLERARIALSDVKEVREEAVPWRTGGVRSMIAVKRYEIVDRSGKVVRFFEGLSDIEELRQLLGVAPGQNARAHEPLTAT